MTKRLFDLALVIATLPVWAPAAILLAVIVRHKLGSPVIFRQERLGLNGNVFTMYKFRSMSDVRDGNGQLLPDELRLTRFGQLLRSTSLDELPELINVLRGDMSLVGPRPLLARYLERYTPEQRRRHEMPPGITGWAQVNGRNAISWEDKFRLDVWYVENHNLLLDIKILCMTVYKVVARSNINQAGPKTMDEFMGSSSRRM